ncbi:MAG: ABC transporter permease [Bdellovibrionales bacterium]|nr:ABC transporter permease [Bdellovibrionales bacterium]NQZ18838.1 ABC transporter permease [Bdellovibrionales bacterium]
MSKLSFLNLVSATLGSLFKEGVRIKEVIRHIDEMAYRSLNIVVICVSFAASVTILEASFHMKLVLHDDSLVPGFASMLIVRELAVVVMSLLLAAKIGAGIAAEVGQMKISEQTDALKLLGINPFNYLVLPRLLACLLAGLTLSLIANAVCLVAALGVTVYELDQSVSFFMVAFRRFVLMKDLMFSLIKGMAFCAVIPLVSCYYGMTCQPGAAGVGRATTKSVVTSSIAIIVIDFLLTYLFSLIY